MKALDEDGGGEIDVAEFEAWWNSTPLVPNARALSLWEKASEVRILAGSVAKLVLVEEQIPDASSG